MLVTFGGGEDDLDSRQKSDSPPSRSRARDLFRMDEADTRFISASNISPYGPRKGRL